MTDWDVAVVGGGPAGAAAAWEAATKGARVVVIDKAVFPRDKPCGDGLTPRTVKLLDDMGLAGTLSRFHRVDALRVTAPSGVIDSSWPVRQGFPAYGYVAPRTEFDALLIEHANRAGAHIEMGTSAVGPLMDGELVTGVRVRRGSVEYDVSAKVVIAADGASSPLGKASGLSTLPDRPVAVALRAQVPASRPPDHVLEAYFTLHHGRALLPGYGWVFPMGGGRLNVGVGLLTGNSASRTVNLAQHMHRFVDQLPAPWNVPSMADMQAAGLVKGWKLPMGFATWPPWRPGLLAAGDAAGVIKPFSGAGISKAIQSGRIAAECGLEAIDGGHTNDFSQYQRELEAMWGAHFRVGRWMVELCRRPWAMRALVTGAARIPSARTFVSRLASNVHEEAGGGVDAAIRAVLALASRRDSNDSNPSTSRFLEDSGDSEGLDVFPEPAREA